MILSFKAAVAAAAFLVSALAFAVPAQAETITVERDTTQFSSLHGGEIKVLTFGSTVPAMGAGVQVAGGLFQTFCLEADISLANNTTYNYTLATGATGGGVTGGDPDPLDAQTAYLFTQFWNANLSNYDYTLGTARIASATSLQNAIWKIEGELVGTLQTAYDGDAQAQAWVAEAAAAVAANGSWFGRGIGNVRVINPTNSLGADIQSMLVLVPLPPAALSGLSILAGLAGAAFVRRRNRRALV